MKSIKTFIQLNVLLPRVTQAEVLVVYDPKRRYRDLCLELAGEQVRVIDAGQGSILAREEALRSLMAMGEAGTECKGLLVYVPAAAPLTAEDKQRDPFSACLVAVAIKLWAAYSIQPTSCLERRYTHARTANTNF